MDITLQRILSLTPKKENGKFQHGALAEFARKLGFKDGHIVSDWIAGNSTSYLNYLYQISFLYHVSVEWLKGETDEKSPPTPEGEGLSEPWMIEAISLLRQLDPENQRQVFDFAQALLKIQESAGGQSQKGF